MATAPHQRISDSDDETRAEMGEGVIWGTSYYDSCTDTDALGSYSCTRIDGHSGVHMWNGHTYGMNDDPRAYWVRD